MRNIKIKVTPATLAKSLLLISSALVLAPSSAQACTNYYVATTGNDKAAGTLAAPWKSIAVASKKIQACDTLNIRGGTYTAINIILPQIGTATTPTIVQPYNNETVIIDGTGTGYTTFEPIFNVTGQYITITNFEIRNGGSGVFLAGNYNTANNLTVHHNRSNGILAQGDYSVVENSTIYQNCLSHYYYLTNQANGTASWGSGLSAARNPVTGITFRATLKNNTVYNNWGEGLSTYEANGTTITNNVVYDNLKTNTYISNAANVIFSYNLVYNTPGNVVGVQAAGLSLADELSNTLLSSNNIMLNNNFLNADVSLFSWTLVPNSGLVNANFSNNSIINGELKCGLINQSSVVQNNIFYRNDGGILGNLFTFNGLTFTKNLWSSKNLYSYVPNIISPNDKVGNPLFTLYGPTGPGQLSRDYFNLQANSPVWSQGTTVYDVNGAGVVSTNTSLVNIGAYPLPLAPFTIAQ
jgi:parallel beta-helix repeat protein